MSVSVTSLATESSTEKATRKKMKGRKEKNVASKSAGIQMREDDVVDSDMDGSQAGDKPEKKRKRDATEAEELEIDINLPEPPSKKALRKAKKQKPSKSADADGQTENTTEHSEKEEVQTARKDSAYGIWIGNLPWSATKPMLATFFTVNAEVMGNSIPNISITRIHLPAPANARPDREGNKPVNKGFAYVDFDSKKTLEAALALSEVSFGGRKVLIKEAKNFDGRPEKDVKQGVESTTGIETRQDYQSKNVSRRVFVGNLGFDVTKEDLEKHYGPCGAVVDLHMATFEDTGKCKGFAWVTFENTDAAEAAVRGWVRTTEPGDEDDENITEAQTEEEDGKTRTKKPNTRKWFVNRLLGRQLRCEFAEDASTRYKKRFGKDATNGKADDRDEKQGDRHFDRKEVPRSNKPSRPVPSDKDKRRADKLASLKAHSSDAYGGKDADSRYRTGGIAPSQGKKITFE